MIDLSNGANFKLPSFYCVLFNYKAYLVILSNYSYTLFSTVKYFSHISLTYVTYSYDIAFYMSKWGVTIAKTNKYTNKSSLYIARQSVNSINLMDLYLSVINYIFFKLDNSNFIFFIASILTPYLVENLFIKINGKEWKVLIVWSTVFFKTDFFTVFNNYNIIGIKFFYIIVNICFSLITILDSGTELTYWTILK